MLPANGRQHRRWSVFGLFLRFGGTYYLHPQGYWIRFRWILQHPLDRTKELHVQYTALYLFRWRLNSNRDVKMNTICFVLSVHYEFFKLMAIISTTTTTTTLSSANWTYLKLKEETSKVLYLEHSIVWYWKLDISESRSEMTGKLWKTSWAGRVKNEILRRVRVERNIQYIMKISKANWVGNILRRNCLLKQVIEVKIEKRMEVTGKRGRRRKHILDKLNTLRTGLLNCLNARSRALNFRHRASCI